MRRETVCVCLVFDITGNECVMYALLVDDSVYYGCLCFLSRAASLA